VGSIVEASTVCKLQRLARDDKMHSVPEGCLTVAQAFQRRVSWPNYSRPVGTAENTTDGDGVPFQACLRRADLFISLPTTEVAGYWQGSLRDRTSSSYTMACWVMKLGFSSEKNIRPY
jgi:hypothetical protein